MRKRKNPLTVKKTCLFCETKYDVKYVKRDIQKYCSKKCANADPKIKEKIKKSQLKTFNEKYGCSHPMKTDAIKDNFKKSIKEKYGVESYSQTDDYVNKVRSTSLKKYGVDNYAKSEECKEKIRVTNLEKYGVSNPMMNCEISGKSKTSLKQTHFKNLLEHCKRKQVAFLGDIDQYTTNHWKNKYRFKCSVCKTVFESDVFNFDHLYCEKCNPIQKYKFENEFYEFLLELTNSQEIPVYRRDRSILYGKELDFYIPSLNMAFELNGLYWHSENSGNRKKNYHLNKTKVCAIHGIRLVHIFENEWNFKKDIIKSIVRNSVDKNTKKIFARKCDVRKVSIKEKNKFLNENHIQGEDKSSVKVGLFYNDELVSLMTFRRTSRFDKNVEWELMRFVNKIDTLIIGGASKLFKSFVKAHDPNNIVSYSDRRYFTGTVYNKLKFNFIKNTTPNYYYTMNQYKDLKNRMSFQKHKLKNVLKTYDSDLTEWENMQLNGYDRIWDCGNSKWIWKKY